MAIYNKADIGRVAQQYGFVRDTFEKVLRLKDILRFLNEEDYLREHLLLKGGTAINMERFIDKEYVPELLFDDKDIVERIKSPPMALWKC